MGQTESVTGRTVVALGGNAIAPAGTGGTALEQIANIGKAMRFVAELIVAGHEVVLTHGNGPQVGNLLLKNELARDVVPAMPLDWCVAQTQATIGYVAMSALERELAARGNYSTVVPVISRVLVGADDPAWQDPTKPIGPYVEDEREARRRADERGQVYKPQGSRGWRRVVPSPEPVEILEPMTIKLLLDAGAVVVANGGGGIPMVRDDEGTLHGVEAVIDKDLAGALLAQAVHAETYAILTDVAGVALHYGTPQERWLEEIEVGELRTHQADGHFAAGSMGPKVEAACRFVESSGRPAIIGALSELPEAIAGRSGTHVIPDRGGAR